MVRVVTFVCGVVMVIVGCLAGGVAVLLEGQ